MLKLLFAFIAVFSIPKSTPDLANERFEIYLQKDLGWIVKERSTGRQWTYQPVFAVLTSSKDPKLAMRPAGIENVIYSVATWERESLKEEDRLQREKTDSNQIGDGFDDRIFKGRVDRRTPDLFKSGNLSTHRPRRYRKVRDAIVFSFTEREGVNLSASLHFPKENSFPTLKFSFTVTEEKWYSVGYAGAPASRLEEVSELWQPMIWQEKRLPEKSFLTLAFRCPLPTTLVCASGGCTGVVADPKELPFDPLPVLANSRFGVALRTADGAARPMLFAPALGGAGSHMQSGDTFAFEVILYSESGYLSTAYESIARKIYGFHDYRKNATHTLNETLDNMLEYGMSKYSWFIDSLKGCAYSTDVPGAVKNVSALNPLQMALLTDREDIFWKRALPIMEFLLSREKFLFTLDSTQKGQSPSRKMHGPVAPVSELAALYEISGKKSTALLQLAKQEFANSRIRNLSVQERGDIWQNALALYQASGEKQFLEKALEGADQYLIDRVDNPSQNFNTVEKGFFFWNGFTPDWISLLLLYETTGKKAYLDAAHKAARQYTQFCWYAPVVPQDSVLVNKGGLAPWYGYMKGKGHPQMKAPEEVVPAWRVSEIGLTPESSGTCAGHRGIFMTNYAPWMLRLGFLKDDDFLKETARAAVVGRYANFPGYHMNTARTTAYEKPDYPLHPFKELSVNSFHFNHIWPHMSILVDYLFTEAFVKSGGEIDVPSTFIEGYAYLQSKFYGHEAGKFYDDKNVYPWMPPDLLTSGSKQLNYVSLRGNNSLYLVFLNQSPDQVSSTISLNNALLDQRPTGARSATVWMDNKKGKSKTVNLESFSIEVAPAGITAIKIEGITPKIRLQDGFYQKTGAGTGLIALKTGNARAMTLDFGNGLRTFYLYLREDDRSVTQAELSCTFSDKSFSLTDKDYPFEFSIPLNEETGNTEFVLSVTTTEGEIVAERIPLTLE